MRLGRAVARRMSTRGAHLPRCRRHLPVRATGQARREIRVTNVGTVAAEGLFTVSVFLSDDNQLDAGDVLLRRST